MPDRLTEIRARLELAGTWSADGPDNAHFVDHAPADIAWLLDEVQRLSDRLTVEMVENRKLGIGALLTVKKS